MATRTIPISVATLTPDACWNDVLRVAKAQRTRFPQATSVEVELQRIRLQVGSFENVFVADFVLKLELP